MQAMMGRWPSLLPATLCTGKTGSAIVPGGATTLIGAKLPVLMGMSRAPMPCGIAAQQAAASGAREPSRWRPDRCPPRARKNR